MRPHSLHRVTSFEGVGPHARRVGFDDGWPQLIDFSRVLAGELYGPLQDPACGQMAPTSIHHAARLAARRGRPPFSGAGPGRHGDTTADQSKSGVWSPAVRSNLREAALVQRHRGSVGRADIARSLSSLPIDIGYGRDDRIHAPMANDTATSQD